MNIKTLPIEQLKAAPYNPRTSNEKQEKDLKASLQKFGVVEPIIYNEQTGFIVGGHFRVRELKKLGYKEVSCVIVDLSEDDERELNIRLNANSGDWDWDMLANEWESEELNDWGLETFGADAEDLGEEFELPDGEKEPFQKVTFKLSDEQAEMLKMKIEDMKKTDHYKYVETYGNDNSNGNALYAIICQE